MGWVPLRKCWAKPLQVEREDAIIATKVYFPFSPDVNRLGASRFSPSCEKLNRVSKDWAPIVSIFISCISGMLPHPIEETLRALDDCVKQGKIRYIGLCNSTAWQIAKADGVARLILARRGFALCRLIIPWWVVNLSGRSSLQPKILGSAP